VKQKDVDISNVNVKREFIGKICLNTDSYRFIYIFSTVLFVINLGRIIHVTHAEELSPMVNKIYTEQ
jgi:hypothetical protein